MTQSCKTYSAVRLRMKHLWKHHRAIISYSSFNPVKKKRNVTGFWACVLQSGFLYVTNCEHIAIFLLSCCRDDEFDVSIKELKMSSSVWFASFSFFLSGSAVTRVWPLRSTRTLIIRSLTQEFWLCSCSTLFCSSGLFYSKTKSSALTWNHHVWEGAQPPPSAMVGLPG